MTPAVRTHPWRVLLGILFTLLSLESRGLLASAVTRRALIDSTSERPGIQRRSVRAKRQRWVKLRLDRAPLAQTEELDLELFPDVHLIARMARRTRRPARGLLWTGSLTGQSGDVTLVEREGQIAGNIFMPGKTYEIRYAGNGLHDVTEIDPTAYPTDDPKMDVLGTSAAPAPAPGAALDASNQIDVMVLWTPAARVAAGGLAAIQNVIDLAVANANSAYVNSQVNTQLRLVYRAEVAYAESTDISVDLDHLRGTADGFLDGIHALRNQYGADQVTLLGSGYVAGGACGIGYLMTTVSTTFASNAFNVVDQSCAAGNLSFAHELGHNQGLHHDPANASGQGAYPYAFGYQDPGNGFRTVMSYGSQPRIRHFSSPNIFYNGRVTGVANAQDNARALSNTISTVANFRQATVPLQSACDINLDGGTNVIDVQLEVLEAIGVAPCSNDINNDGSCNVIDVQRVTNAALGGACVSP